MKLTVNCSFNIYSGILIRPQCSNRYHTPSVKSTIIKVLVGYQWCIESFSRQRQFQLLIHSLFSKSVLKQRSHAICAIKYFFVHCNWSSCPYRPWRDPLLMQFQCRRLGIKSKVFPWSRRRSAICFLIFPCFLRKRAAREGLIMFTVSQWALSVCYAHQWLVNHLDTVFPVVKLASVSFGPCVLWQ